MRMHNPPHPGELIKEIIGEDGLNLTITDAAEAFGISRKTLSTIINGRAGISPEMAIRLSISLKTSPESWLNMQQSYDLWHTEKNGKILNVKRLVA